MVSDFDLTLTKYRVKGQLGMTSYRKDYMLAAIFSTILVLVLHFSGVVDTSLQMSEAYRQEVCCFV